MVNICLDLFIHTYILGQYYIFNSICLYEMETHKMKKRMTPFQFRYETLLNFELLRAENYVGIA